MQHWVEIYVLVLTLAAFFACGLDKLKAQRGKWRISEATLLLLAALGGSVGLLAGMLVFRHKIRKPKFFIGVPVILVLQLAAIYFAVWVYPTAV